jgi:GT2 family glycosyltransferase
MYYEDLDLCQRMKAAGFEIWYEPAAEMWHDTLDGARAVNSEYWRWAEKARSTRVFHAKRYGPVKARLLTALTVSAEVLQHLRKGHWRAVWHMSAAEWNHLLGRRR